MGRTRALLESYRSLGLVLLIVAAFAATIVASCGGGGGSSNGDLCDQCGDDPDGPCQPSGFVVPGATRPEPCPSAGEPGACVSRTLLCLRGATTSQRRCYPALANSSDHVDPFFRCDGEPPGPTLIPPSSTPTSTALTPTPAATPVCGNAIREGNEQCDSTDVGGATCESQGCDLPGGQLSCRLDCTFNFVTCAQGGFGCGL